ncbi:hypothetical protein PC129_g13613 [Phytophthora cactorum]|uniref:Uncharacterized protein n=1 Tax=Phytophthora cactorum TaxID=29920 RepID=A0A329SI71_9STRA|nr:hypothetical protein Pcac1_g22917 [Phytophthora cactorum]KAG2813612.1 hypothetical protein PC111_g14317 [Phytophthora cactorum]KAG2815597.1 hypothetical protein PC112_g13810 [Phytophthora cactorum]KAG2853913.1 hypothetical protein PC113_g13767 [Phytophthora cactorum]KAG2922101.1 hypothetical protein PC114_g5402 [Phytophthora cactorum]
MDECCSACWSAVCAGCCITCFEATCYPVCNTCSRCCCGDRGFSCCTGQDNGYRRQSSDSYGRAASPPPEIVAVPVKMQPVTPGVAESYEPVRQV